jgi:hypothetical protein
MDIYNSVKYFFYILKFLGLAPYSFDRKSKSLKMNFFNWIIFFVSVLIWITVISRVLFTLNLYGFNTGIKSKFLDICWKYQYIIQLFLSAFSVVFAFNKRNNVEVFMKCVHDFDQAIEQIQWKFKTRNVNPELILIVNLLSVLICINYLILGIFVFKNEHGRPILSMRTIDEISFIMVYLVVNLYYLIFSTKFILSSSCIHARLETMIKNIK